MAIQIEKFNRSIHSLAVVKELLAMAAGNPSIDKLTYLTDNFYTSDNCCMFIALDDEIITGLIGIDYSGKPQGFISHIAVRPEMRKRGIGQQMIEHAIQTLELTTVEAETDQDAVDFYTACEFETREIESQYIGIRRFNCVKSLVASPQAK